MERDFDTFDPNEALVDEARNRYYPAGWQKGDPVYVLDEPYIDDSINAEPPCSECDSMQHDSQHCPYTEDYKDVLYQLEQRKGLDCE